MIEYINKRLNDWAAWSLRGKDGGLGYGGAVSYCRLVPCSGNRGDMVGVDEDALEIDQVVSAIRREAPARFDVVTWFYLKGDVGADRIARELGCCRRTAYARLQALHVDVQDRLFERSIEAGERAQSAREAARISKCA
jgi:hypothetical protein